MKRLLLVLLALGAATALVYALRPAARAPRHAEPARGPHAEIDDASRARLEQVLREAAREEAKPGAGAPAKRDAKAR